MHTKGYASELALLREKLELYELIFDSIYHGAVVTDPQGIVTHFNAPYGRFLGIDPEAQIGKHCTASVENSRLHLVAKTGKAEINHPHTIMGQKMIVQRIPIHKDGKVVAVFGQVMFKDVKDLGKLVRRLSLLESKVALYEQELLDLRSTRYTFESIIGPSRQIEALKAEARKATANQLPVLISGESGTGKELFAQAIHHASSRKLHPFVRINCAAIPRDLLESELFGYEKGAFTGACAHGKPGKFELAHRGTIFLDEIGDMPLDMQPKLLRVLEEREFERIGGNTMIRSDFRLITATNQRLETMMSEGRFRKDLFYRMNVIPLDIPPLRERKEDIIPVAKHLLKRIAQDTCLPEVNLNADAEKILVDYPWPGNVRELTNVLERTLSSLEGSTIRPSHLPFHLHCRRSDTQGSCPTSIKAVQAQTEKEVILDALQKTDNNKVKAAELLGIHRTLLYKKMHRHDIPLKR